MKDFWQGDIIKISGYKGKFIIVSKNAFIKATGVFHVCPLIENASEEPLHILVQGKQKTQGVVYCEQIKLIDPAVRVCKRIDEIPYGMFMNVSDAIQGVFEYD